LSTIADSDAFKDRERLLPQHQAALTLLQARLSAPTVGSLSWLDLACGRGQIILSLDSNLSLEARSKLKFWAYDLDQDYARETTKAAERLGFASLDVTVGDLSDFDRILPSGPLFDFITLTNTVHEIEPVRLATLLVTCLRRLTDTGTLFIYDMDRITPPELGAVPWSRDDVRRIVRRMLGALGAFAYRPEVGLWNHRTCNGWNVQLERQHLGITRDEEAARMNSAIRETRDEVSQLLIQRLSECRASLETLTNYGAETVEEQGDKENLLYEFWALSRALERTS
jgi:ubiquinone/menaquinone biosynthesis C-methylase UbiE